VAEDLGYTTTAPSTNGDKLLPKRAGVRTMLPSAWIDKTIRLEYIGAATDAPEISTTFLDWTLVGLLLNIAGGEDLARVGSVSSS
jgi:hypothetical protein